MEQDKEGADLLYGVGPIATFLGMPEKPTRHRIDRRQIPTFKIGGTICATKSSLREWLADLAAKAKATA